MDFDHSKYVINNSELCLFRRFALCRQQVWLMSFLQYDTNTFDPQAREFAEKVRVRPDVRSGALSDFVVLACPKR